MISYVEGEILFLEANGVVVKTAGLGYQVLLPKNALENLSEGQRVQFFTYQHVREDALELYGFLTRLDRQIFLLLIQVSGVGPKLALTILSALRSHELIRALIDKDIALLSSVSGIGKKTAERLSLELKDKAMKIDVVTVQHAEPISVRSHLEDIIKGLGYTKAQGEKAVLSLDKNDLETLPLEDLIKKTLNLLSKNRAT